METLIFLDPSRVVQTELNNAITEQEVTGVDPTTPPEPPPEPPPITPCAATNSARHLDDLQKLLNDATRLFIQMHNLLSNYARHVEHCQEDREKVRKDEMLDREIKSDKTQETTHLSGPA